MQMHCLLLLQSGQQIPPAYVFVKSRSFAEVLSWIRSIGNVGLARYADPDGWNDPDRLKVENPGLTLLEQCAEFSLWAEMAAPLLISTDVARLSRAALAILSNSAVVAVDQDPLGMEATRIKEEAGVDILSRPLANGDRAVIFRSTAVFGSIIFPGVRFILTRAGNLSYWMGLRLDRPRTWGNTDLLFSSNGIPPCGSSR